MNGELEISLITKIWETYSASINLADEAKKLANHAVQKAIECGQYLIEAKTVVGHGGWLTWLQSNFVHERNLSHDVATKYMRLATTPPEDLKDAHTLRQAYYAAGILDKPASKGDPINRDPEGTNWITTFDKLNIKVAELFDARPINLWTNDEKAIFVERTRPVVKRFVEAGGKL